MLEDHCRAADRAEGDAVMSDSGNVQSQDGGGSHGEDTTSGVTTPNVGNKVTVVLGAQWGDEGKGKVVDLLAQDADIVCRCQVVYEHCVMLIRMCFKHSYLMRKSRMNDS